MPACENDIPQHEDTRWLYALTIVWQISWDPNLGRHRNLLVCIILSKYQSSRGAEILWWWPRSLWLGDLVCRAPSKILHGTLCDMRNPSIINLSPPFMRDLNNELQFISWNMAWYYLDCKIQNRRAIQQMGLSESNHILPISSHPTLTSNESAHSNFENRMTYIHRTNPCRNPFRSLPEIGLRIVTKSITANAIHFAVSQTKISLQIKIFQWINWPAV